MSESRLRASTGGLHHAGATLQRGEGGFTALGITAAVSVLALVAVLGLSVQRSVREKNNATTYIAESAGERASSSRESAVGTLVLGTAPPAAATPLAAATSTDLISYIGPVVIDRLTGAYAQMQQTGTFSADEGAKIAQDLAPFVRADVSFKTYTKADITTSSDTSEAGMLAYRAALQTSLRPLLKNTTPEYEIFGSYVKTKDPTYLKELSAVAENYRDAASATQKVRAPEDAAAQHIAILNAMQEFAATLDALAAHADDPFASVALLRSYNQAEQDMFTSFNALYSYDRQKATMNPVRNI